MSANVINPTAYLRVSREFPNDIDKLTLQMNKSWVDIANSVNVRIIGIFPTNRAAITGEEWFFNNNVKQQTLRQVYTFTATGNIPHNIFSNISLVSTKSYGSFTDGTNFYGVIYANSAVPIAGQLTFHVTPSVGTTSGNIVIAAGAGAPAIVRGLIVLEWLSSSVLVK
jgi:hypothetical protein